MTAEPNKVSRAERIKGYVIRQNLRSQTKLAGQRESRVLRSVRAAFLYSARWMFASRGSDLGKVSSRA